MGESKVLKNFNRMLGKCKEGDTYRRRIFDFDTIDYIPKKRVVKGMIVDRKEGTFRVDFCSGPAKYIEDASSLEIGDEIIIFGKENPNQSNSILPSIIINPKDKLLLLSQEQVSFRFKGVD